MSNQTFLSKGCNEDGDPWVAPYDDGTGVMIEAPGCGTAYLNNAEARALLAWLNKRYILDELADV